MKRRFTILTAALALLVSLAIPMGMWGQSTVTFDATTDITANASSYQTTELTINAADGSTWTANGYGATANTNIIIGKGGANYLRTPVIDGTITSVSVTWSGNTNYYLALQTTTGTELEAKSNPSTSTTETFNVTGSYNQLQLVGRRSSGTSNAAATITMVVVTYTTGSTPTPSMSVSTNSIDFGSNNTINPSNPYTETFDVTFANLTQNLTITGFSGVTVSPATINHNATSPQTVTVSYNPTAAGSISGNISVNSSEVNEQLVTVTGSAYDPSNIVTYERYTGTLVEGDYIICANEEVAMKNVISSNRFANEAVTVTSGKITNPDASIIWHIAPDGDHYTMYNAAVDKYAAGTSSNNQGTLLDAVTDNARWDITYQYSNYTVICYGRNSSNNKYLRRNGTYGWATYTNSTGNVPTFYKKVVTNQVAMPTFSLPAGTYYETKSVELSCETTGATIYYTTDGTTPSASNGTEYTTAISVSSTMTIKAIAVKGGMSDSDVATAEYTIEQPYNTIPALFAAATAIEQDVRVTFDDWVVSGVSTNGKNVYVTDNSGNGFIIYFTSDMSSTFAAGNILSGTAVSCKLKLYNGAAELVNLNVSDLTITTGGTVSTSNIAMASLAGVNTGALVHYSNLTCSVTTSGDNTYYDLSDGTTTIRAYGSIFSDYADYLENGKTYNITGIYQQYNSTKEILPRSAADIVEVQVQHDEYTLTVGNPQHVTLTVTYGNDDVLTNGQNDDIEDGTEVSFTTTVESGYVLTGVSVVGENSQSVTVTETSGVYTFTMPAYNVTVNATATDASGLTTYTLATSIESGKQYIIVGKADSKYYAMGYNKGNNRHAVEITSDGTTATVSIDNTQTNAHEFTITSLATAGFYSICDAIEPGYLYAASSGSNYLKTEATLDENHNGDWEISINSETGIASIVASNSSYTRNVMQFNNGSILFACYGSASQHAVYLYVKDETPATETFTKTIAAYTANDNGWYLIASPIGEVAPGNVTHMLENTYDLFSFDQTQQNEWQNFKQNHFTQLEPGKGYLYANSGDVTLTFTGTAYTDTGTFPLVYNTSNPDSFMHGWNLMGNPYGESASVDRPYYTLNDQFEYTAVQAGQSVESMEGIFVHVTEAEYNANQNVTFTPTSKHQGGTKASSLTLNITKGGKFLDRAIVDFSQGGTLPKFQFNRNHTKVYIPQDGQDYAVVRSEEMGEMPVNFKAENNGTYSLSFSSRNAEFAYLHLVDNMTGKDIDLLQTPSYSFEAKTTDYESRFKLVFATGDNSKEDNFAFFSNGSFIINNEGNATLQVIDIMGRIIKSASINGCTNVNVKAAPGVYMLRLVNGDNVKVQKVVVE